MYENTKQLISMLERNDPEIKELHLSGLINQDLEDVLYAMRYNSVVRKLKITLEKDHHKSCASSITMMLISNKVLRFLDLSGSYLSDEEARSIASGLYVNKGLLSLNLKKNDVGGTAAEYIAMCIAKNNNLTHIDLSNNAFGLQASSMLDHVIANKKNISSAYYWWQSSGVVALLRRRTGMAKELIESWKYLFCDTKAIPSMHDAIMYKTCAAPIAYRLYREDISLGIEFENHVKEMSYMLDIALMKAKEAMEKNKGVPNLSDLLELKHPTNGEHPIARL
ncbi:MAG: hypothetical protein ACK5WS_02490 [Alphaproteobacteria bacterium]|jgi:hypothetical protein|nr:hypothetical protein [Candidatus Jidaibacter sp.]